MISFIVIGKNIENTISLCLDSVLEFIHSNKIYDSEILYIDSDSSDSTIKIAERYPVIIILIKGEVNSAIGRNVGAKNSRGTILFFIDGDMELLPDFYTSVFNPDNNEPIYPFINGYLCHKFYDEKFQYLYSIYENIPDKPIYRDVTGGLMIIMRKYWEKLNGMDERLIRNQDLDFGLRMSKTGTPAMLYNARFAYHHTGSYFNKGRFFDFYFSRALFSPGLLMRKHIFNIAYLKRHYQEVLNAIILIITIIMLYINPLVSIIFLAFYTIIQLFRVIKNPKNGKYILKSFLFKFLFNFYSLTGLLFYYPSNPDYTIIKVCKDKLKV